MFKRFLQRWLGIQELSDMIALKKPTVDVEAKDPSDMWPEATGYTTDDSVIIKGYDKHQSPTA